MAITLNEEGKSVNEVLGISEYRMGRILELHGELPLGNMELIDKLFALRTDLSDNEMLLFMFMAGAHAGRAVERNEYVMEDGTRL